MSLLYLVKYACITIITNKHFVNIDKKHFRPTLQWMVCMTLDCVGLIQSSVIRIINRNVGLECLFHLPICLLLWLVFSYISILQGSVKTHLRCGGIYINHINENCQPVKKFWKSVNNWQIYGQKKSATFFIGPRYIYFCVYVNALGWW